MIDPVDHLPPNIRIGPFDFALQPWDVNQSYGARRYGECSCVELRISISRGMAAPVKAVDTLIHEIGHALFWAYGIDAEKDDEERLVGSLATAWTAVYRDNPWLLAWIAEALAE